jgi:hypothetical protein
VAACSGEGRLGRLGERDGELGERQGRVEERRWGLAVGRKLELTAAAREKRRRRLSLPREKVCASGNASGNLPSDQRVHGDALGTRIRRRLRMDRGSKACTYGGSELEAFPAFEASGGA